MRWLLLVIAVVALEGCATNRPAPVNTFCTIAKPITWATSDTDPTIAEVKEHNAVGAELCQWKGTN